jgi:hypothetical protein
MHSVISIFLYLLRLALEKVPWAVEKNVYCVESDEMFCRHQVGPFDLFYILDLGFFIDFLFG